MIETTKYITSTGADILDLVAGGGYPYGQIINIIGPSGSGKSFLAGEAIYQAKKVLGDKLKVRYNDAESGFTFNTEEIYGYSLDKVSTPTIQDFAADLGIFAKGLKHDEYGFYIVDSFDGLASDADLSEFEDRMKAVEAGKTYDKGSYDMSKQKYSSKLFRTLTQTIDGKNIVLFIISQIRDNVNAGPYGTKWTISGGKALEFYSSFRFFLKRVDTFEREGRAIGYTFLVEALKSRSKYPNRSTVVNILYEFGVDRVGTNLDYLFDLRDERGKLKGVSVTDNIPWKEGGDEVNSTTLKAFLEDRGELEEADEYIKENLNGRKDQKNLITFIKTKHATFTAFLDKFGVMDRESLIQYIEENGLEEELAERATRKWLEVEERIRPVRKKKTLE